MIPIFIDTQELSEQLFLTASETKKLIDFTVKEVTTAFARNWENEANQNLSGARFEYLQSIVVVDEGYAKGAVVLRGWLPNAIEQGEPAFDMKPGMLSGPNAKVNKKGVRYNTIPFRMGTPGTLGVLGPVMPEPVYEELKDKPLNTPVPGGGSRSKGLKIDEIPQAYREPETKKVPDIESQSFNEYKHKSSKYEGAVKVSDAVTGQNRYMSFRRVSDNSDPASWIHPGFEPRNFAEKALQETDIPKTIGRAVDKFLSRTNLG